MTSSDLPNFSAVGLEYARRYAALTEAREIFNSERRRMLIACAEALRESLNSARLAFSEDFGREGRANPPVPKRDLEEWSWSIDRQFTKVWNARRKKDDVKNERSKLLVRLYQDSDLPFGFNALVWFGTVKGDLFDEDDFEDGGQLAGHHPLVRELVRTGVDPKRIWGRDDELAFAPLSIDVDAPEFSCGLVIERLRALPQLFVAADELVAEYYMARTGGKTR